MFRADWIEHVRETMREALDEYNSKVRPGQRKIRHSELPDPVLMSRRVFEQEGMDVADVGMWWSGSLPEGAEGAGLLQGTECEFPFTERLVLRDRYGRILAKPVQRSVRIECVDVTAETGDPEDPRYESQFSCRVHEALSGGSMSEELWSDRRKVEYPWKCRPVAREVEGGFLIDE